MSTKSTLGILVFLAIFASALTQITDPDFGWHLKTGEYIVRNVAIPNRDIFSFTAAGQPWITEEWLTEVVIYLLFIAGGYLPVMVFFALIPAAALTLVYWRTAAPPLFAALGALFAAWVVSAYWGTRPQMVSLLFASYFLFILERYRRDGAGRFLWCLVPAMLIWPNAHGGFAVGPALIFVYLFVDVFHLFSRWDGDRNRIRNLGELGSVLVLCLFVIAFNPNGIALYKYPFQTLLSPVIQTVVIEWQPPDLSSPALFPFVIFLTLLLTSLVASRRNFGLVEVILILGFTFASLRATRQIALWTLVAAPIFAVSLNDARAAISFKRVEFVGAVLRRRARVAFALGVVAIGTLALVRANMLIANQANAEMQFFPVRAVKFIQDNGLSGPIFNRYEWGGYLIWKMYPQEKVFIDGRTDVYGLTDTFFYSQYSAIYNASPIWRDAMAPFNIHLVLVDAGAGIVAELAKDSRWTKLYEDRQAVVFARK